jgi:hypothetical protein
MSLAQFLKRQTNAHKYRDKLSKEDIDKIIEKNVPQLRSIQILKLGPACFYPEVIDEYQELQRKVIQKTRQDLQNEFVKRVKIPFDSMIALRHHLSTI